MFKPNEINLKELDSLKIMRLLERVPTKPRSTEEWHEEIINITLS